MQARVHFQDEPAVIQQAPVKPAKLQALSGVAAPGALQRSKSLGAADMASREPGVAREAPELGIFPGEVLTSIRRAVTGKSSRLSCLAKSSWSF